MANYWIRKNHALRTICVPIIQAKRFIDTIRYKSSTDAEYIRTLKNQYKDSGKPCFIIGNGPSLKSRDLDMLKEQCTIAFNRIFDIYPITDWRPTFYMVNDPAILESFKEEDFAKAEAGTLLVANHYFVEKCRSICNIHYINMYGKNRIKKEQLVIEHISEDVSRFFTINQSIVINALELAFYMGFKKIFLLGVDHNFPVEVTMNGKQIINQNIDHHFSLNADQLQYPTRKEALTKCFEVCRSYADEHGIKIYNSTRGGKLEVFERVDFDKLMAKTSAEKGQE